MARYPGVAWLPTGVLWCDPHSVPTGGLHPTRCVSGFLLRTLQQSLRFVCFVHRGSDAISGDSTQPETAAICGRWPYEVRNATSWRVLRILATFPPALPLSCS